MKGCQAGHNSLISDACKALGKLPEPVKWEVPEEFDSMTEGHLNDLLDEVTESMNQMVQTKLLKSPRTADSLAEHMEYDCKKGKMVFKPLAFRAYLRVSVGAHRKALIHVDLGNHQLAVERL